MLQHQPVIEAIHSYQSQICQALPSKRRAVLKHHTAEVHPAKSQSYGFRLINKSHCRVYVQPNNRHCTGLYKADRDYPSYSSVPPIPPLFFGRRFSLQYFSSFQWSCFSGSPVRKALNLSDCQEPPFRPPCTPAPMGARGQAKPDWDNTGGLKDGE